MWEDVFQFILNKGIKFTPIQILIFFPSTIVFSHTACCLAAHQVGRPIRHLPDSQSEPAVDVVLKIDVALLGGGISEHVNKLLQWFWSVCRLNTAFTVFFWKLLLKKWEPFYICGSDIKVIITSVSTEKVALWVIYSLNKQLPGELFQFWVFLRLESVQLSQFNLQEFLVAHVTDFFVLYQCLLNNGYLTVTTWPDIFKDPILTLQRKHLSAVFHGVNMVYFVKKPCSVQDKKWLFGCWLKPKNVASLMDVDDWCHFLEEHALC